MRQLLELGVKDSNLSTSDKKSLDLAEAIKDLVTLDRFNVIVISPEKYNALYVKFKNLNRPQARSRLRLPIFL